MTVYVPIVAWKFQSRTVAVRDCITRQAVVVPRAAVALPDGVTACVAAESLDTIDGRHKVRLPNGSVAWVRPLELPAARTPELSA